MDIINTYKTWLSCLAATLLLGSACPNVEPSQEIGSSQPRFDPMHEVDPPVFSLRKSFGIVITAYNRPEYLRKTLDSLKKSNLKDAMVVIVDDSSTNPETISLINEFDLGDVPLFKLKHRVNSGVLTGLLHGFKLLVNNAKYVLNIDSDVIVKEDWLDKLAETHENINDPDIILTGFNTANHPTRVCEVEWCEKESIGGINFFMTSDFYVRHFHSFFSQLNRLERKTWRAWDWIVVDQMKRKGYRFYTTKPSVIQHIGFEGLNSRLSEPTDTAEDF